MHDIKLIRECPEVLDKALEKRGEGSKSSKVIALDTQRRKTIEKLEKLLAERKMLSKKFGAAEKNNDDTTISIRDDIKKMKHEIASLETSLRDIEEDLEALLLSIPNLLSDDVPIGQSETDNVEVYRWGEIKSFNFQPKEHFEVGATKNDINFEFVI